MKRFIVCSLVLTFFFTLGCGGSEAKQPGITPKANKKAIIAENYTNDTKQIPAKNATVNNIPYLKVKTEQVKDIKLASEQKSYGYRLGDIYLNKYRYNPDVKQLILIEQNAAGSSEASLSFMKRDKDGSWVETLKCKAYLGRNGIDKQREGDGKTPTGDFAALVAFGIKEDPGSQITYKKVTSTMYLCGDKEYYNQLLDISQVNHKCTSASEHLIKYVPQYNYGIFLDYNKDGVYGKGSAIFLHCNGSYPYTLGCISVKEEHMVYILKNADKSTRFCIYPTK